MADLPQEPQRPDADARVRRVELVISALLRGGVLLSLLIVVIGAALSFRNHRDYFYSKRAYPPLLLPDADFPRTIPDAVHQAMALNGRAIVVLGLLVLVLTPVLRVAVAVLAFLYQRDRPFVLFTLFVLAMLVLSFVLGKAEG